MNVAFERSDRIVHDGVGGRPCLQLDHGIPHVRQAGQIARLNRFTELIHKG